MQVGNGQLCTLHSMDIAGDGRDVIVGCWWDGTALIVDRERNAAAFRLDERVSAFVCGTYAVHRARSVPCFVYVTLFGEIRVLHGVRLAGVAAQTLDGAGWGGAGAEWDRRELPALCTGILYGVKLADAAGCVRALREQVAQAQAENRELAQRLREKGGDKTEGGENKEEGPT